MDELTAIEEWDLCYLVAQKVVELEQYYEQNKNNKVIEPIAKLDIERMMVICEKIGGSSILNDYKTVLRKKEAEVK